MSRRRQGQPFSRFSSKSRKRWRRRPPWKERSGSVQRHSMSKIYSPNGKGRTGFSLGPKQIGKSSTYSLYGSYSPTDKIWFPRYCLHACCTPPLRGHVKISPLAGRHRRPTGAMPHSAETTRHIKYRQGGNLLKVYLERGTKNATTRANEVRFSPSRG